jgi:hypothetical protein
MAVPPVSWTDFALTTLPTRADEAGGPPPTKFYALRDNLVAADAGPNEKHIGTFIRGQGNPTYSTLLKLRDGLNVSLATLMLRAEEQYEKRCGQVLRAHT